jgi:hypothetical protein
VRTVDAGANAFAVADGLLLATGGTWTSDDPSSQHGIGLAAYGPDLALRYRALPGTFVGVQATLGGRAYVYGDEGNVLRVLDVATGRVVGSRTDTLPWLLLDD